MKNDRVLSAIQPTGDLHLGNYLGAVHNWVEIQDTYDATYGIVDGHSITMPYKADQLRERTWEMALQLLACGIDEERLFIQSLVPEHFELAWILSCVCSYGDLTRMTQFKDKSEQLQAKDKSAFISGGLFFYPVLQAADILIYRADYVPVGKDQEQHLELTRSIAQRFNHQYNTDYFNPPDPLFTETPKILSLADPSNKMSKSLGAKHYINLFDEEGRIRKQVKSAVTDTGQSQGDTMSPGVANLFSILKASGRIEAHRHLMEDYQEGTLSYKALKDEVSDGLMEMLAPIRKRYDELRDNKKQVKGRIEEHSAAIRKKAIKTVREVKEITGLLNVTFPGGGRS